LDIRQSLSKRDMVGEVAPGRMGVHNDAMFAVDCLVRPIVIAELLTRTSHESRIGVRLAHLHLSRFWELDAASWFGGVAFLCRVAALDSASLLELCLRPFYGLIKDIEVLLRRVRWFNGGRLVLANRNIGFDSRGVGDHKLARDQAFLNAQLHDVVKDLPEHTGVLETTTAVL